MAAEPRGHRRGDALDRPVPLATPVRGPPTSGGAADEGASDDDRPAPDSMETVGCPECGTENDPDYRYCRDCVAELPGSDALGGAATDGGLL